MFYIVISFQLLEVETEIKTHIQFQMPISLLHEGEGRARANPWRLASPKRKL